MRRGPALAVAVAVALTGVAAGPATPGAASTYYDYWSYWHKAPGATAWQYSKVGPSGYYLKAGKQVEGWRYAIGTASSTDPKPRPADVTYDAYCAGHDASATYRVLLVVDYGTQSGAPSGPVYSCYGFDPQPSGLQVLTKQHSERDSGGLICAIDNYPKTGCGDVVSSPAPKATRSSTPTHAPPTASTSRPATATAVPTKAATSPSRATRTTTPTTSTARTDPPATPAPSAAATFVAKQFVPPRNRGGSVPPGFIAGCVFVVALIGGVLVQRRRRSG